MNAEISTLTFLQNYRSEWLLIHEIKRTMLFESFLLSDMFSSKNHNLLFLLVKF